MSKYKEREEPIYQLQLKHDGYVGDLNKVVGTYKEFDISVNSYSIDLLNMFYISRKGLPLAATYLDGNGELQHTATYFQNIIECLEAIDKYVPNNL